MAFFRWLGENASQSGRAFGELGRFCDWRSPSLAACQVQRQKPAQNRFVAHGRRVIGPPVCGCDDLIQRLVGTIQPSRSLVV